MQHILSHIHNAQLALSVGDIGSAEAALVCAAKLMEASSNSLQQLKAEIASRLRDYDEYTSNGQYVLARQSLQAIRQLSAV